MRVLALVTDAFGGAGGIAAATRATLIALAAAPSVAAIGVLPRSAPGAVGLLPDKVTQGSPRSGRGAYTLGALAYAAAFRPDLIYCNHLYMAPLARLAAWLARAKFIVHVHGVEIWEKPTRARRTALESAQSVVCVSRHTRGMVLRYSNTPPERAVVINNTVSERFRPGERMNARVRLGLDHDARVVLTVGRLASSERYKGHERTIDALAGIAVRSQAKLVYLIAGDGDDRARLERLVRERKLNGLVRFLGHTTETDLVSLYQAADLFVMPSTGEGFGIAFIEAMACGTPALGLAAGGARDALVDGQLGACVAEEDFPAALAAALESSARPEHLAQAVQAHFGQDILQNRFNLVLGAVSGPAASASRP